MSTIAGWTSVHADAIHHLVSATLDGIQGPARAAAVRTNGLPVYCDIGGCLVITQEGRVLEYAFEGEQVSDITDRPSVRLACAVAAEKYPALADLRPTDGSFCKTCNGTGRLGPMQLRCGVCDGTGLVA
jgi:hypothetical protein